MSSSILHYGTFVGDVFMTLKLLNLDTMSAWSPVDADFDHKEQKPSRTGRSEREFG